VKRDKVKYQVYDANTDLELPLTDELRGIVEEYVALFLQTYGRDPVGQHPVGSYIIEF
jgi:hypothetical protein